MSILQITVPNADEAVRHRAVEALINQDVQIQAATLNDSTPTQPKRDFAGVVLGAGFAVIFGALTAYLAFLGGWWIAPGVLSALLSLVGLIGIVASLTEQGR
ncbi:hypothetical protein [Nocardiopsis sp. FR4]|uniref:hypothetical protein n=1 Tax=Nocardiopsis sp. FR4 TaxID=2605985 RepID=UPI00135BCE52|nr:hypothetical protein [Nocardiopsis sp. FR4]